MQMDAGALLLLSLVGGLVAIDGTSFGQFMISRPLVAATLGGWITGDPVHGALIGLVLEAFHLTVLPVGAAKYPEGGPAAVAGGAVYGASGLAASTLFLTVVFVLAFEWLSGETVRLLRQANVHLVQPVQGRERNAELLERRHIAAIGLDFVRGVLLVMVGIAAMGVLVRLLTPLWGLGERLPGTLLAAVVAGLLAGSFRLVGSRPWMAAAGAGGALLFLLLA